MNFIEAKEKLAKLAKGKYHTISYEITKHSVKDSAEIQECSLYIHGYEYSKGDTWKEALSGMRKQVHPKKKIPVVVEPIEEIVKK